MIKPKNQSNWLTYGAVSLMVVFGSACDSEGNPISTTDETATNEDSSTVDDTSTTASSCDEIATKFVTQGSANAELPDPEVSASCVDGNVIVTGNQIPDFPWIPTTPGTPQVFDLEFTITATPTLAEAVTDVPLHGPVGIATNGIPIFGPTEGVGGDVLSMPSFTECGGHVGPGGYHFHTFSVTGSNDCMFTEAEASAEPQKLFGYALDGYPIYSGNTLYISSWYLSDPSLFAIDTFAAHTYAEGSGDLDQCNGRTDENGNYAYYTTDSFPYALGCFRGDIEIEARNDTGEPDLTDVLTNEN